ncbi:MAG: hypothetical protein LBT59_07480 [Clostridiales bacterium]|nr:hypothetical protein [Clostridiales bacterium]
MSDKYTIVFTNDKYEYCGYAVFNDAAGCFDESCFPSKSLATRIGVDGKWREDCAKFYAWLKQRMPKADSAKTMVNRLSLTGGLCTTDEYTCFEDRLPTRMVFKPVKDVKGGEKVFVKNNWICTEREVRIGMIPSGAKIGEQPLQGFVEFVSEFGAYITLDAKKEVAR